ncbi:hypothetical protein COOONC_21854 [Cooperia oncophora]
MKKKDQRKAILFKIRHSLLSKKTTPKRSLAGRSPQSVSPPHSYNSTTLSSPRTGSRNVSNFATGISSSFDDTDGSLRSPSGKRHSTNWPTDERRAHSEDSRYPSTRYSREEESERDLRASASGGSPRSYRSHDFDRSPFRRQSSHTGSFRSSEGASRSSHYSKSDLSYSLD